MSTVGDDHFSRRVDIDIVHALDPLGDGFAQGGQASRRRVVGVVMNHGVFGGGHDMRRRIKVGVAAPHDDDIIITARFAD